MYTTAKVSRIWERLFPAIKKTDAAIEVTLRGETVRLPFEEKRSQVQSTKPTQYR